MIAERRGRVAAAVIEGVADQAAPTGVRAVHPNLELVLLYVAVEVEVAHARLDERRSVALVDLEDPIHALQVEHDAAGEIRGRAAVAEILAGGNRVDRYSVRICSPDDRLHLFHGVRGDGSRCEALFFLSLERRIRIPIQRDVVVALEHPLGTDALLEFAQCVAEVAIVYTRGQRHEELLDLVVIAQLREPRTLHSKHSHRPDTRQRDTRRMHPPRSNGHVLPERKALRANAASRTTSCPWTNAVSCVSSYPS